MAIRRKSKRKPLTPTDLPAGRQAHGHAESNFLSVIGYRIRFGAYRTLRIVISRNILNPPQLN